MPLLQRFTTPIAALLPDTQHMPQRKQALAAILASLVAHVILFLLYVVASALAPESKTVKFKDSKAELQPLEVEIMPVSEAEILTPDQLLERAERAIIDSAGLARANEAAKDAPFESDQDMKAASQKPATGDAPLPSQEGRDLPFPMFKDQNVVLGSTKLPPADAGSAQSSPPPAPPPQPPAPEPKVTEVEEEPEPPPPPQPEPPKNKTPEVPVVKDDQIAISSPITRVEPLSPTPRQKTQKPVKPKPKRIEVAKLSTPSPRPKPATVQPPPEPEPKPINGAPGYQEEQTKTKVEGSISNRGANSVDAEKTPRGVYIKQVKAQIGSRWYYYMKQRRDLYTTGSAKVSFIITAQGKVRDVRLMDNTSNTAFGLMCEQCVIEAEITPPPEEVLPMMPNGQLENDFTFNYVPIQ